MDRVEGKHGDHLTPAAQFNGKQISTLESSNWQNLDDQKLQYLEV